MTGKPQQDGEAAQAQIPIPGDLILSQVQTTVQLPVSGLIRWLSGNSGIKERTRATPSKGVGERDRE